MKQHLQTLVEIQNAEITEGNFYITEDVYNDLHHYLNEVVYKEQGGLFNMCGKSIVQSINTVINYIENVREEEIDQVVIVRQMMTPDGTPYTTNITLHKQ